jgi:hypothetical protein
MKSENLEGGVGYRSFAQPHLTLHSLIQMIQLEFVLEGSRSCIGMEGETPNMGAMEQWVPTIRSNSSSI